MASCVTWKLRLICQVSRRGEIAVKPAIFAGCDVPSPRLVDGCWVWSFPMRKLWLTATRRVTSPARIRVQHWHGRHNSKKFHTMTQPSCSWTQKPGSSRVGSRYKVWIVENRAQIQDIHHLSQPLESCPTGTRLASSQMVSYFNIKDPQLI